MVVLWVVRLMSSWSFLGLELQEERSRSLYNGLHDHECDRDFGLGGAGLSANP
jgi:hypothetical protein